VFGSLERKLQPKLNDSRVVHRGVYRAESRCVDVVHRQAELGVVEQVEELGAEVQAHIFPRQRELFDHGKVRVHEVGAVDGHAGGVAECEDGGRNEAGGVYVLQLTVVSPIDIATRHLL
jgi:hypothetical protein